MTKVTGLRALIIMKTDAKQTLISLSLAGTIGYYLYNKLVESGVTLSVENKEHIPAKERTEEELSWRPEVIEDEPTQVEEDYFDMSDDLTENLVEEELVKEEVEQVAENVAEYVEEGVAEEITEDPAIGFVDQIVEEIVDTPTVETIDEFILPEVDISNDSLELDNQESNDGKVECENVQHVEDSIDDLFETIDAADDNIELPTLEPTLPNVELPNFGDENDALLDLDAIGLDIEAATEELTADNEGKDDELVLDLELDVNDNISLDTILVSEEMVEQNHIEEPVLGPENKDDGIYADLDLDNFDDLKEDEQDTSAEDLFKVVNDEPIIMENVEPLHKVDNKDVSSKQEFKNIMDFFSTL